jgi:uncharacterized membrane protein
MLSKQSPVLLTTGERVPAGTNGGVTWQGTTAAIAGGALMGTAAAVVNELLRVWSGNGTCGIQVALQCAERFVQRLVKHAVQAFLTARAGHSFNLPTSSKPSTEAQISSRLEVAMVLVVLGIVWGTLGCFLDSLLGATLQFSGWDEDRKCVVGKPGRGVKHIAGYPVLDNNGVNMVASASITFCALGVHGLPVM